MRLLQDRVENRHKVWGAEYRALDEECKLLTEGEQVLGSFALSRPRITGRRPGVAPP